MTQPTREELADGPIDLWTSWLRSALLAFTARVPAYRKVRAFAPLVIDPDSGNPAGEIFDQIRSLVLEPNGAPANAAIEVLRTWDPEIDGWKGAALLLQIATRLGGRNLQRATMILIGKSANLLQEARQDLAYLAVRAADSRFRRSEVDELVRTLWQVDLLDPDLLGSLALVLAREDFGGLENLPKTLAIILPEMTREPHDGRYLKAIATSLLDEFNSDELALSLEPAADDDEAQYALRAALRELAVPWAGRPNHGTSGSSLRGESISAELDERVGTLEKLGDQVDKKGKLLYFPASRRK